MEKGNHKMYGILLKNKLERDLEIDGIMMKKDSADSPNFTLNFPVPENDLTGRSKIEKEVRNFYSNEGFKVKSIRGEQLAINEENKEAYLIGLTRSSRSQNRKYNIRVARTDNPQLFYNKK